MKNLIIKIANYRLFQHLIFWVGYVMFFGLVYGKFGNDYTYYFLESLGMVPFVMGSTYAAIYVILPYYLKTQHLFVSFILFFGTLLFFCTLQRIFLRYINNLPVELGHFYDLSFLSLFLETNFMVGIAMAIKLIKKWMEQQKEKFEFEKRSLESELNLLKAQIHPHFLFNTMNNLYALSLGQSPKTSEGIAKVAELLHSVLYDCAGVYTDLEKELNFIGNYLDLQKLRYGDRLSLDFEIEGNIKDLKVAPMLFITFIENCFKHGAANDPEQSWIRILFRIDGMRILFLASNGKPKKHDERVSSTIGGIGLANAQKRLDILYNDNYQLNISDSEFSYSVELEINTALK